MEDGTTTSRTSPPEGRSARKRRAIMEAATTLFLRNGYQGTSMDEVAAQAAVSKQTVYKNFSDKEQLFSDIIAGISTKVEPLLDVMTAVLDDADNLERNLYRLARTYVATVIHPAGIRLRRLMIAEAERFPDLARDYYERAPERTLATLASCFERLAERGRLRVDDPMLAANHFAFLILSRPLDRALFYGVDEPLTEAELERFADSGVRVFLAAYGRP